MSSLLRIGFLVFAAFSCSIPASSKKTSSPAPPAESSPSSAEKLLLAGEAEAVIALFEKESPRADRPELSMLYARALRLRGRFPQARAVWERLAARNPELAPRLERELFSLAMEEGNFPEAARRLSAAQPASDELAFLRFLERFEGVPHRVHGESVAKLPFAMEGSPLPAVECRMEGQGSIPLLVDTGASFCVLTHSLAKRIGLFSKVTGGVLLDLEGKPLDAQYATVGVLEIGGIRVENVPVVLVQDEALRLRLFGKHDVFQVQGVLGMSLLRQFQLTFDFPARTVEFSNTPSESFRGLSMINSGLALYVPVESEPSPRDPGISRLFFRLDTGSNQSALTPAGLSRWGLEERARPRVSYVGGASGWGASLREVDAASIRLGDFRLQGLRLAVAAVQDVSGFEAGGVLGVDLLQPFRVRLDPISLSMELTK